MTIKDLLKKRAIKNRKLKRKVALCPSNKKISKT
jgi:hypothetical protein